MKPIDFLKYNGNLPNARVFYYPDFYNEEASNRYFRILKQQLNWQSYKLRVFGKIYDQPRLTAMYNDSDVPYSYSSIKLKSYCLTPELISIKRKIESLTNHRFNSVLANLYRYGKDSNGWHADNEPELGLNPVIASVSFGEDRFFHFKHNDKKEESYKIKLSNGSLLIMEGEMQHYWKHQIPKTKKIVGERINLTYRLLKK